MIGRHKVDDLADWEIEIMQEQAAAAHKNAVLAMERGDPLHARLHQNRAKTIHFVASYHLTRRVRSYDRWD